MGDDRGAPPTFFDFGNDFVRIYWRPTPITPHSTRGKVILAVFELVVTAGLLASFYGLFSGRLLGFLGIILFYLPFRITVVQSLCARIGVTELRLDADGFRQREKGLGRSRVTQIPLDLLESLRRESDDIATTLIAVRRPLTGGVSTISNRQAEESRFDLGESFSERNRLIDRFIAESIRLRQRFVPESEPPQTTEKTEPPQAQEPSQTPEITEPPQTPEKAAPKLVEHSNGYTQRTATLDEAFLLPDAPPPSDWSRMEPKNRRGERFSRDDSPFYGWIWQGRFRASVFFPLVFIALFCNTILGSMIFALFFGSIQTSGGSEFWIKIGIGLFMTPFLAIGIGLILGVLSQLFAPAIQTGIRLENRRLVRFLRLFGVTFSIGFALGEFRRVTIHNDPKNPRTSAKNGWRLEFQTDEGGKIRSLFWLSLPVALWLQTELLRAEARILKSQGGNSDLFAGGPMEASALSAYSIQWSQRRSIRLPSEPFRDAGGRWRRRGGFFPTYQYRPPFQAAPFLTLCVAALALGGWLLAFFSSGFSFDNDNAGIGRVFILIALCVWFGLILTALQRFVAWRTTQRWEARPGRLIYQKKRLGIGGKRREFSLAECDRVEISRSSTPLPKPISSTRDDSTLQAFKAQTQGESEIVFLTADNRELCRIAPLTFLEAVHLRADLLREL